MKGQGNRPQQVRKRSSHQKQTVSVREVLYRIFSRLHLLLTCVILIPLLAMFLVSLVPPSYRATAKILIRHNVATSSLSGANSSTYQPPPVTSQSLVELLTSLPVSEVVVRELDIKSNEIAKPALAVIISQLIRLPSLLVGSKQSNASSPETVEEVLLAKELQATIIPQITDSGQAAFLREDELIEVGVSSFSQQRVAMMANTLCEETIDAYYRMVEADAWRIYRYLGRQIVIMEASLTRGPSTESTMAQVALADDLANRAWQERDVTMNPIVARTSGQIAEMEIELSRLRAIYGPQAIEVQQMEAELADANQRLKSYKAQESTDSILNALKERRHQAYLTLQVYKNRLIPITIVEKAVTPLTSSMPKPVRLVVSGGFGLIGGLLLGLALVMFLWAIDNRICTPWDVEQIAELPILGSVAADKSNFNNCTAYADLTRLKISDAAMRALGEVDLHGESRNSIFMVTGPARGEGKTTMALQVACALAHDKRVRVLLIDADFINPDLTRGMLPEKASTQGFLDVIAGEGSVKQVVRKTPFANLSFLPAGTMEKRSAAGLYRQGLHMILEELRMKYDLIVIDTPGVLQSVDAVLFAAEATHVLMVIKAGVTRRETFLKALHLLSRMEDKVIGFLLNFRTHPIPQIFYGQG